MADTPWSAWSLDLTGVPRRRPAAVCRRARSRARPRRGSRCDIARPVPVTGTDTTNGDSSPGASVVTSSGARPLARNVPSSSNTNAVTTTRDSGAPPRGFCTRPVIVSDLRLLRVVAATAARAAAARAGRRPAAPRRPRAAAGAARCGRSPISDQRITLAPTRPRARPSPRSAGPTATADSAPRTVADAATPAPPGESRDRRGAAACGVETRGRVAVARIGRGARRGAAPDGRAADRGSAARALRCAAARRAACARRHAQTRRHGHRETSCQRRRSPCPTRHREREPPSRQSASGDPWSVYRSLNSIATSTMTSTGVPYRRAGEKRHWRTASIAR